MSERSTTTIRIPTARLRPAIEAALAAWFAARDGRVEEAIRAEMSLPEPVGWWARTFDKRPAKTRAEAIARLKAPREYIWSRWEEIHATNTATWRTLSALKDACDLGLDAVDVSLDDVGTFKAHYDASAEGYR